jgi:hypothetical protein
MQETENRLFLDQGSSAASEFHRNVLLPRLRSLSPDELRDLIQQLCANGPRNQDTIAVALETLASKDANAALCLATMLPEPVGGQVSGAALSLLARSSPKVVRDWILGCDWKQRGCRLVSTRAAEALAAENPDAAIQLWQDSDPNRRAVLAHYILGQVGVSDFPRAIAMARQLPEGPSRDRVIDAIVYDLSYRDGGAAFAALRSLASPAIESRLEAKVVSKWLEQKPHEVIAILPSLSPAVLQEVLQCRDFRSGEVNIDKICRMDPNLTKRVLDQLPLTGSNTALFSSAAKALAQVDLLSTLAWLDRLPPGSARDDLYKQSIATGTQRNPEVDGPKAIASAGSYRAAAIEGVAHSWGQKDPEAAVEFAGTLPLSEQGRFVSNAIVGSLTARAASETAAIVAAVQHTGGLAADASFASAVGGVANRFAIEDRGAAIAWASGLGNALRASAYSGIVKSWVATDANGAAQWLSQLQPGAARDAGVLVLIDELATTDPQMAEQWRASLTTRK